jgi:CheY-like chemotaxis protein
MNDDMVFLVVDDLEGMRSILTNSLNRMGMMHVLTASNGADAWRLIQRQQVDMVISDWNMPVMTGLDLLRHIRASDMFYKLPVLMLTAETEPQQVRMAIEAGVSGYMVKPFRVDALEAKIRNTLDHPRLHRLIPARPVPVLPPVISDRAVQGIASADRVTDPAAPDRKAFLLMVDDEPYNLDVLVDVLGEDYRVTVFDSGKNALESLVPGALPDLILLDLMMPEMDGYEVCRHLKANPVTADIPVIFLSAMTESIDMTRGFDAGAVDFVSKPAHPRVLRARVATHLKLRRSIAELECSRSALFEQNAVLANNLRLRDEFERIAQHDLKNPIAGIINFAACLLSDPTLAAGHKKIAGFIEQSALSVLNMVNLSLDLYKMEQGRFELHPRAVDLMQLLTRIADEMATELASREVRIELLQQGVPTPPTAAASILGDEFLCYSLFNNLLKNAMEAAAGGTTIQIDMDTQDDQVKVRLTNDGVVPGELRASFFDKFSTSGKPKGSGLGTFSARLIAQTQGGHIDMETSDARHNTSVTVRLPGACRAGQEILPVVKPK